jgi:class 3 adenylate cyclase/predicted ATPase
MFVDMVGSTALSERLDPEDLRELLRAYQETCAAAVDRFDGHVAKYIGDGILVYFGYPQAHEDDARRAVSAGLGIVDGIAALNRGQTDGNGVELGVRVGIHTGLVVVGEMGGGETREAGAIVGETPNVAARLESLAAPNSVAISAATERLVEGLFESDDLGPRRLKGVSRPITVFRIRGQSTAHSRFEVTAERGLTPMVGREEEIGLLLKRWRLTKEGEGQVVLLSGEAGVGKSRILRGFRERLDGEPHNRVLYYGSAYHRNSAFHPVIDQIERGLRFTREDGPAERLAKLEALLSDLGLPVAEYLPLHASLMSMPEDERYPLPELDPQALKARTLEAVAAVLETMAARAPALIVVEDAHWIDPSTLELLTLLIERLRAAPILMVITFRPVFEPPWSNHPHLTLLTLNRLSRRECADMVTRVTAGKSLPAEVLDEIVAKTDGVPLYVEELTKSVLESGLLEETAEGYVLTGPLPPLAIPASLQDSLMARLDRLGEAKEVAQLGATLGRTFDRDLLAAVSPLDEADLENALGQLVGAELLFRRGVSPDLTYEFKHALVRDAAYQSLLKTRRRALHGQIAEILAQDDGGQSAPELVAHHYTEAGLAKEAVRAWERAAAAALERAALREATQHFRAALAQLALLPESNERDLTELRILTRFGSTVLNIEGWASSEAEVLHERARDLAGRLDNTSTEMVSSLVGLWLYHITRARHDGATKISQQLFHIARKLDDPELLLQAHHAAWPTSMLQGDPSASCSSIDHGLAIYDEARHRHHAQIYMGHDPAVCGYSCGAIVKWAVGLADQAAEYSNQAIALARRTEHVPSLVHGLIFVCEWRVSMADHESALEVAEELYALSEAHQLAASRIVAQIYRGWARAKFGEVEQGIRDIRDGLEAWQSSGARAAVPQHLSLLAAAYAMNGDYDDALAALERALREIAETGERQYEAEIYFRRGRVLLDQKAGDRALAERSLHASRDVARKQLALAYELRATVALAELWADDGKRVEARESLAGVLDRFEEGFDTPDFEEAKALLDELG